MPEYESCEWSQATHVANADRSIVYPVCKHDCNGDLLIDNGIDARWMLRDSITHFRFEPVKEKKVGWEYCGEDVTGKIGIYIDEDSKKIYRTRNATIDLAEKICRLLNEEDKRNELC